MSKNPSTTFYFNDWENDAQLKTCSLTAQGLWMRLLCIAARSPEPGIVQIEKFDMSPPRGLTLIASAVGQPLDAITLLIDELLASGAASRDRKSRIYCRRMVRAAALSEKRAKAGLLGAEATHGKKSAIVGLPPPLPSKPDGPSRLPDSKSSSQESSPDSAARASASPDGPPRTPLPDSAKWKARLDGHRPWLGERNWQATWGLSPDSSGVNHSIPKAMLAEWKATYRDEMAKARSA